MYLYYILGLALLCSFLGTLAWVINLIMNNPSQAMHLMERAEHEHHYNEKQNGLIFAFFITVIMWLFLIGSAGLF